MNKMFQPLVFTVFAFVAILFSCQAQTEKPVHTLLWKVEGSNIQTSYVYGTLHVLPEDDFLLKDKVVEAFSTSDQIVLELDMDDPNLQSEMFNHISMKEGETLADYFSPAELDTLNNWCLQYAGFGIENMMNWKPFMVSTMILSKFLPGKTASFERTFIQMASEQGKEIKGLETIYDQLSIFDQITYEEQAEDLKDMIHQEDKYSDMYDQLIELYQSEKLEKIYDMVAEAMDEALELELLIENRNTSWVPRIQVLAAEKSTFFGVGAGHLGGPHGVITLLKQAGYTLTPIK